MATADTIKQYFVNILQRDPTAAETSYWVATVDSGALTTTQARDAIAASGESVTYVDQIIRIYQAAFGRVPDTTGINGWTDQLRADATALSKVAAGFVNSTEWKNRYGDNTVNDAVLQALYQNVLGRTGSAAEIAAWKATGQSMTQILIGFSNSAEFQASSAAGVMALKRAAGDVTTANLATVFNGTSPLGVDYGSTNYTLTTGVDTITGGNGTDKINGILDAATPANTTFNPLDTIDGGAGNDTIALTNSTAAGATTLSAATVKNVENLSIRSGSSGALTADVQTWSGLENITVEQAVTANVDIDTKGNVKSVTVSKGAAIAIDDNAAAGADKLATVSLDGSTGAATITSDALAKLTVANSAQNVTVTAAAGTRALDLTLNNVTGGVIADATATSVKVTASGAASTGGTLTANAATKIDFAGDKTVSTALGAQAANLVITSTNTAGTTIITALNTDVTFTGGDGKDSVSIGATTKAIDMGKGDDTVAISSATLGSGGSVTGGEGTDTVSLSAANAYTASATTTFAGVVKGFETLQFAATGGAAGTIDLTKLNNAGNNAITKVIAGAVDDAVTISGLASGNTVEFKAANTAATTATVTNAVTGTADVLNIGITNVAGININTVVAADIETVNFLTDDTATTPTGIQHTAALTATAAKTITVTGDAGLNLGTIAGNTVLTSFDASGVTKGAVSVTTAALANAATLKGGAGNDTINASAATKAVTIESGAGDDTVTGSATETNTITTGDGNDTITGGAKADTINAGAGNDTITSGKGLDIIDVGAGDDTFVVTGNDNGNTYASLTGMGKGDKLDFADKGTSTFTTAKITLADTALFADYLNAAAAGDGSTNGILSWFQFGGNTYVVQDVSAANTFQNGAALDQVVKLVGLVDLSTATVAGATAVLTLG
ncbi:DUF4214 domain-containing protein [Pannonibacter sp. SL95]|uniref:DUF4214 domain-containing protein n=1 Tax=Pannonibacter sp. SL95 TaxID=2995153 RepID=UPI002272787B|nr:DUF4214 domain-containing protein [Pannonibacter sp. SL95]MCY1707583.1 DUF4214 domain-containing protein [Pannonibacter sp. SL95]